MEAVEFVNREADRRIEELREPFELGHAYARVERATLMPDGKFETDGEHAISLAVIATCYATKYYPELDPYKVFFYGVMHDIDEFLDGDVSTMGATEESLQAKYIQEERGAAEARRILDPFPGFLKMLDEMYDIGNPESKFGKAMDKVAPGFTHKANNGQALRENYGLTSYDDLLKAVAITDKKLLDYAASFVDVIALRHEMHRKIARAAFKHGTWVDVPLF